MFMRSGNSPDNVARIFALCKVRFG